MLQQALRGHGFSLASEAKVIFTSGLGRPAHLGSADGIFDDVGHGGRALAQAEDGPDE